MSKKKRPAESPAPSSSAEQDGTSIVDPEETPGPQLVPITCPLAELCGDGHFANPQAGHVAARLDSRQATALNRIFRGLDDTGARMGNGKRVFSRADAVRWLLEQLSE